MTEKIKRDPERTGSGTDEQRASGIDKQRTGAGIDAPKPGLSVGPKKRGPGGGGPSSMMPGEKAKNFGPTMKTLLSYLKPYRISLFFVFLFAIVSTVFSILSPDILGDA
nr:hypothetical protein [Bacillota bacterium]